MKGNKQKGWLSIDVDQEVFSFLQQQARPFVDTPNDVLRRLLLKEEREVIKEATSPSPVSSIAIQNSREFDNIVLRHHFKGYFRKVRPFQLMFESAKDLVYFQNYNKEADKRLWYRLSQEPWQYLTSSQKDAWLCLTYPLGRYAYIIPVKVINSKVREHKWEEKDLEISIYPLSPRTSTRWHELNWDIETYRYEF